MTSGLERTGSVKDLIVQFESTKSNPSSPLLTELNQGYVTPGAESNKSQESFGKRTLSGKSMRAHHRGSSPRSVRLSYPDQIVKPVFDGADLPKPIVSVDENEKFCDDDIEEESKFDLESSDVDFSPKVTASGKYMPVYVRPTTPMRHQSTHSHTKPVPSFNSTGNGNQVFDLHQEDKPTSSRKSHGLMKEYTRPTSPRRHESLKATPSFTAQMKTINATELAERYTRVHGEGEHNSTTDSTWTVRRRKLDNSHKPKSVALRRSVTAQSGTIPRANYFSSFQEGAYITCWHVYEYVGEVLARTSGTNQRAGKGRKTI